MIDSASSSELGELTVAQELFAPSGPARRAPLARRSGTIGLGRAWAPLNPRQHGRIDPSRHTPPRPHGVDHRTQVSDPPRPPRCREQGTRAAGPRPHAKAVVEISDGAVVSPRPLGAGGALAATPLTVPMPRIMGRSCFSSGRDRGWPSSKRCTSRDA